MAICELEEGGFMTGSQFGQADTWLSWGLAFVGGYGDAASFVLTKTFTGHVTGNLVLAAIAVAAHDWRGALGRLSAIVTFLIGTGLSLLIVRQLRAWPPLRLLPFIIGCQIRRDACPVAPLVPGPVQVLRSHVEISVVMRPCYNRGVPIPP